MLAQLIEELGELWRDIRPRLAGAWDHARSGLRMAWGIVKPPLVLVLQIVAALLVLFEEWGWRPLVDALSTLSRFRIWAAFELWVAGLPPYGALAMLVLPTTILLPLKFVAVFLLVNGLYTVATMLFIGAKITSTALIARIFMLTKPALMQIGWFARAFNWFMPWKEALFAQIRASWAWRYGRMVKLRIKLETKKTWARWKPRFEETWRTWGPWLKASLLHSHVGLRESWRRAKPRIVEQTDRLRLTVRRAWQRAVGG